MLITGKEKLERMRDGRAIYIGAERVEDVTRHAAFRNGARTIAALYDRTADPQQRELFTFEEKGERYGLSWLRCRTREDIARRILEPGDVRAHVVLSAAHDAFGVSWWTLFVVLKLDAAIGELIDGEINVVHSKVQNGEGSRLVVTFWIDKHRATAWQVEPHTDALILYF